ncbi:MAG TPA: hypothetical protein VEO01_41690 [Pseudonocardiaceae bacterium]|nr:hypothetical protein [Pseudonocardiaceae bacterium]
MTLVALIVGTAMVSGAIVVAPHLGQSNHLKTVANTTTLGTGQDLQAPSSSSSQSISEDDLATYTDTSGSYVVGRPIDVMADAAPCVPSIAICPQFPSVPNHLGWVTDCTSNGTPDSCGFVFDHATSDQIVRYTATAAVGALGTVCGPAASLCGGIGAALALAISDNINPLPNGRCLYLHLINDLDVSTWINGGGLVGLSAVGARIMDCPAS